MVLILSSGAARDYLVVDDFRDSAACLVRLGLGTRCCKYKH